MVKDLSKDKRSRKNEFRSNSKPANSLRCVYLSVMGPDVLIFNNSDFT